MREISKRRGGDPANREGGEKGDKIKRKKRKKKERKVHLICHVSKRIRRLEKPGGKNDKRKRSASHQKRA